MAIAQRSALSAFCCAWARSSCPPISAHTCKVGLHVAAPKLLTHRSHITTRLQKGDVGKECRKVDREDGNLPEAGLLGGLGQNEKESMYG